MDSASKDVIIYTLPPVVAIESVENIAADFKQWLFEEKSIVAVDASQVETITTPGLQLLVSLQKTVVAHGGTLTINGKRESLINALKDAGLTSMAVQ